MRGLRGQKALMLLILFAIPAVVLLMASPGEAQTLSLPNVSLQIGGTADTPGKTATALQLLLLLTVLSLAPAILLMLTSFTRIGRRPVAPAERHGNAADAPEPGPDRARPVPDVLHHGPRLAEGQRGGPAAVLPGDNLRRAGHGEGGCTGEGLHAETDPGEGPGLFVSISREKRPANPQEVSLTTLIPAFIISELKTAFQIGFMIYLPFFVIDMVVASILLSMGMMMLPPIMMSLPFKLLLFVLVDGWYLVVGSLVESFRCRIFNRKPVRSTK
jgi:flagellar biosynthetic protein FliP